ncbi:MAG: TnpV protein [Eubacteriales bacterium]|nr:TnpV protein [Eubacteriales bacterium]
MSGRLVARLNAVDAAASEQVDCIVRQMAKAQGVDEALKARDQMTWVGLMNNLRNAAEEVVLNRLIYR